MSDIIQNPGNIVTIWNQNEEAEAASPALTRSMYQSTTVYLVNPQGVPLTVEASPNGTHWVPLGPAQTLEAFQVHTTINLKYIRVQRGAGAGAVTATVMSGGLSHL